MVILTEIAQKLNSIFNGTDAETSQYTRFITNNSYNFVVATAGFHLDKIADSQTHSNFIPVFIDSLGGTYNAIPDLKEGTYNIPVTIYYPIRFKDDFYAFNEFLTSCFIGKVLNYGTYSKKCVSNISVSQYGEIVENVDLKEYQNWVGNTYNRQVQITEPLMTMTFNLYLTNVGSDFILGNEIDFNASVNVRLKYFYVSSNKYVRDYLYYGKYETEGAVGKSAYYGWKKDNDVLYTATANPTTSSDLYMLQASGKMLKLVQPTITSVGTNVSATAITSVLTNASFNTQTQSEPKSQQVLGTNESESLPISTAYSTGLTFNYKRDAFHRYILEQWIDGDTQEIEIVISYDIDEFTFTRTCFLQSSNLNIAKGEPITFTVAFAKKVVD